MRSTAVLLAAAAAVASGLVAGPAAASPGSARTAIVAMGDSYISGEAGRWHGNSVNGAGDRDGTDRACAPLVAGSPTCTYDQSRVYLGGSDTGCHRSDVAEIRSADVPGAQKLNISCSGGVTKNIFRAANGGEGQNGEAPQADQLLPLARANDVKLIMLSVGGNDLGFASIVAACFTNYEARRGPCRDEQQRVIDAKKAKATADVGKAIDEIRAVMTDAGYGLSDYRLVVQTYPSVIPRASESRHAENDPRRTSDGCPFYDTDLTWARDSAAGQVGAVSKAAAASRGVEVLELVDALQGREICARTAQAATPTTPPSATTSEWGRALSAGTIAQGEAQEVFHPNAYAQRALGACVTQLYRQAPGSFACTNTPGQGPEGMRLARTATGTPVTAGSPGAGGSAGGGGSAAEQRGCDARSVTRAISVRPSGRGLRFGLPPGTRGLRIAVFQQSRGTTVVGNRLVASFRDRRRSFTWKGAATRPGRTTTDGHYVVRLVAGRDERRLTARRSGSRFRLRPEFARTARCGLVRLFKAERPVLGGRRNRAVGVAYRIARSATVVVRVRQGGRTVRRYAARRVRANTLVRLRLASEGLARGDVRILLQVTAGGTTTSSTVTVRRL